VWWPVRFKLRFLKVNKSWRKRSNMPRLQAKERLQMLYWLKSGQVNSRSGGRTSGTKSSNYYHFCIKIIQRWGYLVWLEVKDAPSSTARKWEELERLKHASYKTLKIANALVNSTMVEWSKSGIFWARNQQNSLVKEIQRWGFLVC